MLLNCSMRLMHVYVPFNHCLTVLLPNSTRILVIFILCNPVNLTDAEQLTAFCVFTPLVPGRVGQLFNVLKVCISSSVIACSYFLLISILGFCLCLINLMIVNFVWNIPCRYFPNYLFLTLFVMSLLNVYFHCR